MIFLNRLCWFRLSIHKFEYPTLSQYLCLRNECFCVRGVEIHTENGRVSVSIGPSPPVRVKPFVIASAAEAKA